MLRSLGPVSHGIIDYLMVIILAVGPGVAGFSGKQAIFCYVFAALLFFLTVLTRFPLGAKKIIGFPMHGVIEVMLAVLMIVLPWIANFSRGVLSRNYFIAVGVLIGGIAALTDYRRTTSSTTSSKISSSSSSSTSSTTTSSSSTSSKKTS